MKKSYLFSTLFIVCMLVAIFLYKQYFVPKVINLEYPAVEYRTGNKLFKKTKIKINLKGYKRLNGTTKYSGKISIDLYDYTKLYLMYPLEFNLYNGKSSDLVYYNWMFNKFHETVSVQKDLGLIWKSSNFKSITINIFEPLNKIENNGIVAISKDLYISAPAATLEDAKKITEQLKSVKFN